MKPLEEKAGENQEHGGDGKALVGSLCGWLGLKEGGARGRRRTDCMIPGGLHWGPAFQMPFTSIYGSITFLVSFFLVLLGPGPFLKAQFPRITKISETWWTRFASIRIPSCTDSL
jgi:hypothetical protein